MPKTDELLFDAWRLRRDPEAFGEIVRRHAGMVYSTCRRILSNDADAEDVTQECFLHLAQAKTAVTRSLGGWLHKIATHRSLDHLRKESRRRRREDVASSRPPPEEVTEWEELQPHIDRAIDSLPAELRDIIVCHYLEQESFSALGRRLGVSHRTVSYRAEKAVGAIRAHLRSAGISVAAVVLTALLSEHGFATVSPSLVAKLGKIAISGFPPQAAEPSPASPSAPSVETTASPGPWAASLPVTKVAAVIPIAACLLSVAFFLGRDPQPSEPSPPSMLADLQENPGPAAPDQTEATETAPGVNGQPTPTLAVEVVWADTGTPVPQTRIRVVQDSDDAGNEAGESLTLRDETTDALGAVEVELQESWSGVRVVATHELALEAQVEAKLPHEIPLTLALERAYVITGSIVDSTSGTPVAGARIAPRGSDRSWSARSDSAGLYSVKRKEGGEVEFVVSAYGYARQKITVHATERGITTRDVSLNRALDVHVHVVDSEGTPLEGVKLMSAVEERQGYASFVDTESDITDGNGEARLWRDSTFRRRNPKFSVKKEGYSLASIGDLKQGEDGEWSVHIVLEALSRNQRAIEGHVTDEEGNPIAGALVGYNDGSMSYGGADQWKEYAVTDANGFYTLSFANRTKAFLFVAHCRGRAAAFQRDVVAGTPEAPVTLDFTLKAPGGISGTIVDETGQPIEDARVKVTLSGPAYSIADILPDVPHEARTDSSGQFTVSDLPAEVGRIDIHAAGFSSLTLRSVSVDEELSVTLYRPGVVRGRVIDAATKKPVEQFLVRITGGTNYGSSRSFVGESFSSSDGVFLLENLYRSENPVAFSFSVEANGYVAGRIEEVFPTPEDEAQEHVVKLTQGTVVEGYVVDSETGDPLSSVHVFLGEPPSDEPVLRESRLRNLPNFQKVATAEDGAFRFVEEEPATLFFRAPGYRRLRLEPAERHELIGKEEALAIALEKGESLSVTYVEGNQPTTGRWASLRLMLLDPETAHTRWPESDWMEDVPTRSEGRYDWDDLRPGDYFVELTLEAATEGNRTRIQRRVTLASGAPQRITIGDELGDVELSGRFSSPDGEAQKHAYVIFEPLFDSKYDQFLTRTDLSGQFRLIRLPKGRYAVWAVHAFDRERRVVELEPIELTADSEIDLAAWLPRD